MAKATKKTTSAKRATGDTRGTAKRTPKSKSGARRTTAGAGSGSKTSAAKSRSEARAKTGTGGTTGATRRASGAAGESTRSRPKRAADAARGQGGRTTKRESDERYVERHRRGLSRSTQRARWISSPDQLGDTRPGETLATREHEVIEHWAEQRGAEPATVPGTEHQGRPGVLRFQFPDFGGDELEVVDWDDWFATFDHRHLTFLFQERLKNGAQSNFFRLDNPDREDG